LKDPSLANEEVTIERPIDYSVYSMSRKEKMAYGMIGAVFVLVLCYIFYHSWILSLLLAPIGFLYPKHKAKELIIKRKKELQLQFKDLLYALSSSLSAGRSLEGAFRDALKDLEILYPGMDAYIMKECSWIVRKLELNERVEDVLKDLANRSQLEDIQSFVDVLKTCRMAGGNLVEVIRTTSMVISDKIEIASEIDTMIAGKKFEQRMMSLAPVCMIVVLSLASADYMEPIFKTIAGRIAMTCAMLVLVLTHIISQKIMQIEV
jgi:tight adherence protein B